MMLAAGGLLFTQATPTHAQKPKPKEEAKKGCELGRDSYNHGARQQVQITNADGSTQWITIKCNDGNWEVANRRVPAHVLARITAVSFSAVR
jgi:hypothetical protein